jgi:putative endonuclease
VDEDVVTRHRKGRISEEVAAGYLQQHGLKILDQNFRCSLGEIDLVARDGPTIVFVEVRSRYGTGYGLPQESVTFRKQKRLTQLAQWYLKARGLEGKPARFDVLGILWRGQEPEVTWIVDAFEER